MLKPYHEDHGWPVATLSRELLYSGDFLVDCFSESEAGYTRGILLMEKKIWFWYDASSFEKSERKKGRKDRTPYGI